ncbi:MAG: hypothetical protein AAGI68_08365 [Planctomycetota bacterium]
MKSLAHTPITVESSPDGGTLYKFPTRPKARGFGIFATLFGLAFAGFAAFWVSSPLQSLIAPGKNASPISRAFDAVFVVFSLPFFTVGLGVLVVGLAMLLGRASVRVTRDQLIATDHLLLLLRYRRRQSLDAIRRLEVNVGTSSTNGGPKKPMEGFAVLTAETEELAQAKSAKRKPKGGFRALLRGVIAWGYPRDWLRPLADELAEICNAESHRSLIADDENAPVGVIETVGSDDPDLDEAGEPYVPTRPLDATADVTELHPGLSIKLPPRGIRKAGKGMFGFAVMWLGFMAVFTSLGGSGFYSSAQGVWPIVGITAFLALFWAIGLGVLLAALNAGKRRGVIDAIGDTLLVTKQSLFKPKQFEWTADQLDDLRLGPTGTEVNGKPINCLLVTPKDGKPVKLFAERDDEELKWLAALLRRELGLTRS